MTGDPQKNEHKAAGPLLWCSDQAQLYGEVIFFCC